MYTPKYYLFRNSGILIMLTFWWPSFNWLVSDQYLKASGRIWEEYPSLLRLNEPSIPINWVYTNLTVENLGHFSIKLGFILPCKSDWQPIFLKQQGIYSLYAKLWLVRPLIKNIPDSSHQYLSNVTLGASLALQMREEYIFEKNSFLKLDLKGVK